jgi:hypothetical protein
MTEEIKSVDTDDIEDKVEVKTDPKTGRWVKGTASPNPNGRGKGSQSKLNKTKMVTLANKHGIKSFEDIVRLGKKAEKEGQLTTALKAAMFIAEKYLQLILQQDKTALELQKLRTKEAEKDNDDSDNEDEQKDLTEAIFKLQRAENE